MTITEIKIAKFINFRNEHRINKGHFYTTKKAQGLKDWILKSNTTVKIPQKTMETVLILCNKTIEPSKEN